MTDYQPITDADLETGPPPSSPGVVGDGSGDLSKYQPIQDSDLAPSGPVPGQTSEFAYKGIPAAAAKRFSQSNAVANIIGAAATRAGNNFVNSFTSNNDADMKMLVENGYGDYSTPGSLLQHAADAINCGYTLGKNGIMALGAAFSGAVGGAEGQIIREAGGDEASAERGEREGEFFGMAAPADIGAMHGAAMLDAAKAGGAEAAAGEAAARAAEEAKQISTAQVQAAAPGVWGHAYRVDATPDGDLAPVPLGRLPDGAEAAEQAKVVAQALHLPADTATLIHQTYLDTGRPPAEVLMDAQTNHGGVLDDLVAGKMPTAYQGPGRAMTPEELAAARPTETAPNIPGNIPAPEGASAEQTGDALTIGPEAPKAPIEQTGANQGISKIGQSIEAKAVEDGLTKGFAGTAGYDKITIADQAERTANLINSDLDKARAVIRGDEPLPSGMKGTALITAMEDYIKKNPDADLAYELANSPLVTGTSEAAQEMRLAAERTPDSAAAKLQELQQAKQKQAGGPKEIAARKAAVKEALPAAGKVLLPKEELSWDKFLSSIAC